MFLLFPEEWGGTAWYSLVEGDEMKALLILELMPGGTCYTTHAYLRNGEETPFEQERVRENWYYDGRKRLFLMDSWGEFASFLWDEDSSRLTTRIGGETIILSPLSDATREELRNDFTLEAGA